MFTHLDDLSVFCQIVQQGNLSEAARVLKLPKSKISRRLLALENQIGSPLLIRSTRRIELTEVGRLLYQQSQPHMSALAAIDEELESLLNRPKGLLKVLFPLEFFSQLIAELMIEFLEHYPEIELCSTHYVEAFPEKLSDFDIAFVLHEHQLPAMDWISRPLLSFPQSLYAGNHVNTTPITKPADLVNVPCVINGRDDEWRFRHASGIEAVRVSGKARLTSPEMCLRATLANLGVAKLPDYMCHAAVYRQNLHRVNLGYSPVALELSVMYQTRVLPAKTRAFLDFFQSNLGRFSQV